MKSKMNIKSIIAVFILAIMISMLFINMSFAANTAKVKVETANLRKTASEESIILEQISLNDEVEVIEKEGEWYKVKYNSIEGYLREDLIEVQGEIAEKANEEQQNVQNQENSTENVQVENEQQVNNTEGDAIQEQEPVQQVQTENEELGKRKITENTKLKIVPVINASDIIEVKKDEEVNVIEVVNGWACIETQNTKGWIRQEKLQKEEATTSESAKQPETTETVAPVEETIIKTQYVASNTVNVRSTPSTNSEVVTQASINQTVEIYSEANGWSKVKVNGKQGYILSSLLSDKKQETSRGSDEMRKTTTSNATKIDASGTTNVKTEQKSTVSAKTTTQSNANNSTTAQASSSKGAEIVAYAKQFIGTKYKYGGTSPSTGFDCSGFTQYVYKHFGISLPRTTGGQASSGRAINKSELQPGDLVIYSGHVAIYVGGGQVIHAPRTGKTVCIVSLNNTNLVVTKVQEELYRKIMQLKTKKTQKEGTKK